MAVFLELVAFWTLALSFPAELGKKRRASGGSGGFLQNTTKATTIAMMARVKEMPSTQRTTPVVSPCRALVAVSISGCRSDIRNLNATASARFGYHPHKERRPMAMEHYRILHAAINRMRGS